jgi:hypothetical protein
MVAEHVVGDDKAVVLDGIIDHVEVVVGLRQQIASVYHDIYHSVYETYVGGREHDELLVHEALEKVPIVRLHGSVALAGVRGL